MSSALRTEQLIAATIAVIRRQGLDGVTSRAVAAEAGAPLASIHYTFGSVDDMVLAAVAQLIDDVGDEFTRNIDASDGFEVCIPLFMKGIGRLLDDDRYAVLLTELQPGSDPRIAALERRYYEFGRRFIDGISLASQQRPAVPTAQAARLVMAAVDGVIVQFQHSRDLKAAKADLTAFGEMLTLAIAPKLSQPRSNDARPT